MQGQKWFAGLLVSLALTIVGWFFTYRTLQCERVTQQSERTAQQDAILSDLDDQLEEFETAYDVLFWSHYRADKPLTYNDMQWLERMDLRLDRMSSAELNPSTSQQARAHLQKARIAIAMEEPRHAISSLKKARELYLGLPGSTRSYLEALNLAITESRLGFILGQQYELNDAERMINCAIGRFQTLIEAEPSDEFVYLELATSLQNLALIHLLQGKSANSEISLGQQVLNAMAFEITPSFVMRVQALEMLLDLKQLELAVIWRDRDWERARSLCDDTLENISQLEQWIFQYTNETFQQVPTRKYRSARQLVSSNRESILRASKATAETESSAIPSNWQWRSLNSPRDRTISMDRLLDLRLPAEFEHQDAIALSWIDQGWAQRLALNVITAVHRKVSIIVLVENDLCAHEARTKLRDLNVDLRTIRFLRAETDSVWIRDFGPILVRAQTGDLKIVDPTYSPFLRPVDDHLPNVIGARFSLPVVKTPLVLEGGAILSNGQGLCVVSSKILKLNERRGFTKQEVSTRLQRLTGAEQVVYLDGLVGEPNGHVDWFLTFTDERTVVVGDYQSSVSSNAQLLDRHADRLKDIETRMGPLRVERIPMPPPAKNFFGGTYTNVVFANGVLLVPTWTQADQATEDAAFAVYRRLLPGWDIVGIPCDDVGYWQGGLHCAVINMTGLSADSSSRP